MSLAGALAVNLSVLIEEVAEILRSKSQLDGSSSIVLDLDPKSHRDGGFPLAECVCLESLKQRDRFGEAVFRALSWLSFRPSDQRVRGCSSSATGFVP